MDHSYPYIASLTREPFLFYEMRSTATLMAEGNSDKPASNGFMHWKMTRWFLRLRHSQRM